MERFETIHLARRATRTGPAALTRAIVALAQQVLAALVLAPSVLAPLVLAPAAEGWAASPRAGSPDWFNAMNMQRQRAGPSPGSATGAAAGSAANSAANDPGAANSNLSPSVAQFAQAARAIAQAQAAQARAAQNQGAAAAGAVPDGLTPGGLWVSPAAIAANPGLWSGASPPSAAPSRGATGAVGHAGGTVVTVDQTAATADLTWTNFNIGASTTLQFIQGGPNYTVLNRVRDPSAAPGQILGAIAAPGLVLVLNPNGILFGAGSQVNVGGLVASTANLAAAQFKTILSTQASNLAYNPVFTGAAAPVTVQAGASIVASVPAGSGTVGGVYLLGQSVTNSGQIATPNGQTVLAAGQNFIVRTGYSLQNNTTSTTLGLEVAPCAFVAGTCGAAGPGAVTNNGLIQAVSGDITLTGETVMQAGVLLSTTSLSQRGTIHLLTDTADTASSITFAPGSLTAIEPLDDGTTLTDTARQTLINQSQTNNTTRTGTSTSWLSNQAGSNKTTPLPDQQYLSRIEIVSGGAVAFQNGSLTLSTGGQIALTAVTRVFAGSGAALSVAGSIDTVLPATANTLKIDTVQPIDLADAPANRDTGNLANQIVDVAIGELVPIGGNLYTYGGLLQVADLVAGVGHTIGEWTSLGGSIVLDAPQVVAQPGAVFNISGGFVTYAAGVTPNTWLVGNNGKLYNANTAPANLVYTGIYDGFTVRQPRWGVTDTYISPLIAPATTFYPAYTVGGDAGSLTIGMPIVQVPNGTAAPALTLAMEGTIDAGVSAGIFQNAASGPASVANPFTLDQAVVPLPGTLSIGPIAQTTEATTAPASTGVWISQNGQPIAASLGPGTPLPADRIGTAYLSASLLNQAALGGLTVVTNASIRVDAPLTLSNGGAVTLLAPQIALAAPLTARGGQMTIGNFAANYAASPTSPEGFLDALPSAVTAVTLASGATIDTRGVFTNLAIDPSMPAGEAFVNGGSVTIDSSGVVTLPAGSTIDTSAGGAVLANHSIMGGKGGAISIVAYDPADTAAAAPTAPATIAATLRGFGSGAVPCTACTGGALTLSVPAVAIGGGGTADASTVGLAPGFFGFGFSSYTITGQNGVTVAGGTQIAVVQPIQQFTAATLLTPSGTDPAAAFAVALPPLYTPNPATAVLTQRAGAGIALQAGNQYNTSGGIAVGAGSVIETDPSATIRLEAWGQITIDGTLAAPSGTISVVSDRIGTALSSLTTARQLANLSVPDNLSIWLGASSVLDVSGRAATALDGSGRIFGTVPNGGAIQIGGQEAAVAGSTQSTEAFVVVQPGAVLNAAGTSARLDLVAGQTLSVHALGRAAPGSPVQVASNGGTISFDSESGIYLGGRAIAPAGGAGAQGGTFSVNLVTQDPGGATFDPPDLPFYRSPRELAIGTTEAASPGVAQPGNAFPDTDFGQAPISAGKIAAGGFDVVNLSSGDAILFDGSVNLSAGRSIALSTAILGDTGTTGAASVSAPYVVLAGTGALKQAGLTFQRTNSLPSWRPSARTSQAALVVNAANIDVSGSLHVSIDSPIASTACTVGVTCPVADLPGFASMTLSSAGDIRFLAGTPLSPAPNTILTTPGNLTLIAGQVYPVNEATVLLTAGAAVDPVTNSPYFRPDGLLAIAAAPGPTPPPPLTASGTITIEAGVIEQGGVLRAPDGRIALGGSEGSGFTSQVLLLPGSITSVSMNGLTIPFGGTADGTTYTLNDLPVTTSTVSEAGVTNLILQPPQILLNAQTIQVQAGATIDISGGGVLAGAGFVPGRGGSTDILQSPLLALNASGKVVLPPSATNLVFAIVPGFGDAVAPPPATAAPYTGPVPGATPGVGRGATIALPAGVPGLPAGTYTLLPGSDALLPGAFRVELATSVHTVLPGVINLGNGSYSVNGYQGVANTGFLASSPIGVTVTPGAAVRLDAQYNETSLAGFLLNQASLFGQARGTLNLPADAKTLAIGFLGAPPAGLALAIQGTVLSAPGPGGLGGLVEVGAGSASTSPLEIVATAGSISVPGADAVLASDLSRLNADTLVIGGTMSPNANKETFASSVPSVTIDAGATLSAAQVFVVAGLGDPSSKPPVPPGTIAVQPGASIDTLGRGATSLDSSAGYTFDSSGVAVVLAVSNGTLSFEPLAPPAPGTPEGTIGIGICATTCGSPARLLSEGAIEAVTNGSIALDPSTVLGTAALDLSASTVNFGTPPSGTQGLTLTSEVLANLLAGSSAAGAPALRQLTLSATDSIDFYGTVDFNTVDPVTGQSTLQSLQFNAPAMYGYPGAGAQAANVSLTTGTFIWNGLLAGVAPNQSSQPPGIWTGGGSGALSVAANTIVLGYGPNDRAQNQVSLGRLILGFDTVTLTGSQSISGNNRGSLSVYQTGTQDGSGELLTESGGNLTLIAPLLTGAPGSVFAIAAGGTLTIAAPSGSQAAAPVSAQGASLTLNAANISNTTSIVLPSGQLIVNARGSIALGNGSRLDLAGVTTTLFDRSTDGWGGDVTLRAGTGGIVQTAGGTIDVSAGSADAGTVTAIAPGTVSLAGSIKGGAASGASGSFTVRAGGLGVSDPSTGFAALNAVLDAGGVFGGRSFELLSGDLTIGAGTTVTANSVSVSVDAGALTVYGTVNASGAAPGTIRLSANGGLALAAGSVLDAHGTVPQVDSYGQSIDSLNTASVTLTSVAGLLSFAPAFAGLPAPVIDVSAPPGATCALGLCGQVTLNAKRTGETSGDVAISVPAGAANVVGAGGIVLNAFWTYMPSDPPGTIVQDNGSNAPVNATRGSPDLGFVGLKQIDANNTLFMSAAAANTGPRSDIAGLAAYGSAFHLRPGVEIDSSTGSNGNLTISGGPNLSAPGAIDLPGDLDLSGFRYADPAGYGFQANAAFPGSGEPGALVIRAANGLTILGSINDGFASAPSLCQTAPACTTPFAYWELAQPLQPNPNGSPALSWSIRLVAGADLAAADSRIVLPSGQLAASAGVPVPPATTCIGTACDPAGSIELYDPHSQPFNSLVTAADEAAQLPGWSVIRTGAGDLDLLAGGSIDEGSTYAIYTAGAVVPASAAFNPARETFPTLAVASSPALQATFVNSSRFLRIINQETVLKDPAGNTFELATQTSVVLPPCPTGTNCGTSSPVAIAPLKVVNQANDVGGTGGTPIATALPGVTATLTSTSSVSVTLTNTVLGPNGQATNNNATLESLVGNYSAWYPKGGGNLLISAGANISGYLATPAATTGVPPMDGVGDWLWRQGGGGVGSGPSTAWSIEFGTLAIPLTYDGGTATDAAGNQALVPTLTGFTGIGALGGGNVTIVAGGNVGTTANSPASNPSAYSVTQALDIAIGSTGQATQGAANASGIAQTGGGSLSIRVGGGLNGGGTSASDNQANGTLTVTRGMGKVRAGSIGQIVLAYGNVNIDNTQVGDPLTPSPLVAYEAAAQGGPIVVPGDATVSLEARGDLVLGGVGDPTRLTAQNLTQSAASGAASPSAVLTWFSLWQPDTAIDLTSAGGNLVISTQAYVAANHLNSADGGQQNAPATDNRFIYPPTLIAVASSGSIYAGAPPQPISNNPIPFPSSIELAPSLAGQLELLAAKSIYGDSLAGGLPQSFDISGASASNLPSPLSPAFQVMGVATSNLAPNIGAGPLSLFAFEADTAIGTLHAGDPAPARIYAGGDIVDMRYGETLCFEGQACPYSGTAIASPSSPVAPSIWYVSGKPVRMVAGGDIIEPGTIYMVAPTGNSILPYKVSVGEANPLSTGGYSSTSGLIVNSNANDVSVIQAGAKILYANATVAGPGQLYVQAGGTVYQGNLGVLQSLGPLSNGAIETGPTRTGGAGITVLAGAGVSGPNWTGFAQTYLAPDMGYGTQLLSWLQTNENYTGDISGAPGAFEALSIEQQRTFLLRIYFDELNASGNEYNQPTSVRYKSYVRGKTAIASLFPNLSSGTGDITLFGDSGIGTDFGGGIVLLTPGGAISLGNTTAPPTSSTPAGVLTQGTGDIDIYSLGDVALGQSRVFTTFGGSIVIWSATGDIDAGNGNASTQLVSTPQILYDAFGRVTLTPGIPTSGAGIATLAPLPGTPQAPVNLVAPEGIIDAGEAGIRVSGNANLAALSIVNAANVQVGGKAAGLPTIVAPNVSVLSTANAAVAAAVQSGQAAASAAGGQNNQPSPSVITVELIGFGDV